MHYFLLFDLPFYSFSSRYFEGLPLIILMVGSELTAEDGEIEPKEMVEFLTECRLHALSRENYPEEDRVGKLLHQLMPVILVFLISK